MKPIQPDKPTNTLSQELCALETVAAEMQQKRPSACCGVRVWLDISLLRLQEARSALYHAHVMQQDGLDD